VAGEYCHHVACFSPLPLLLPLRTPSLMVAGSVSHGLGLQHSPTCVRRIQKDDSCEVVVSERQESTAGAR